MFLEFFIAFVVLSGVTQGFLLGSLYSNVLINDYLMHLITVGILFLLLISKYSVQLNLITIAIYYNLTFILY